MFVHRQEDGGLKGFLNACSHRGAILTPTTQGNAKTITCRFHGWTYKCSGECLRIKEEEGGYGKDFDRSVYDLQEIGAIASYNGFVFGSLSAEVQSLEDFLGESKAFIDFVSHQSPAGLEVLPGSQKYITGGNWKMSTENAVDGYHTSTVHRIFASTVKQREVREGYEGMMRTETGRLSKKMSVTVVTIWAKDTWLFGLIVIRSQRRPLRAEERLEREYPTGKVNWMLRRGRNLIIFPSLMINDFAATQIRTFRPISVDETEVTIYCLAPSDESKEARYARLGNLRIFLWRAEWPPQMT